MRPILGPFDESMLHRVGPTIPDMVRKIRLVPDMVFPEPPLPYRLLPPRLMA